MWDNPQSLSDAFEDPPAGVVSNFDNPQDMHELFLVTGILGVFFTTIAVGVRYFVKSRLLKGLHPEDYLLAVGYITFIPCIATMFIYGFNGGGRHTWDIRKSETYPTFRLYQLQYALNLLLFVPIVPAKLAVLVQLRRILFPHDFRVLYHTTTVVMYIHTLATVAAFIIVAFGCKPISFVWRADIEGKCLDILLVLIASNCIHVLVDITALVIPMVVLRKIHIAKKRKRTPYSLFAFAALAGAASIARLVESTLWWNQNDRPYDGFVFESRTCLWAIAEIACALIVACLPTMPRFYDFFVAKFDLTATGSSSKTLSRQNTMSPDAHMRLNKPDSTENWQLELRAFHGAPSPSMSAVLFDSAHEITRCKSRHGISEAAAV